MPSNSPRLISTERAARADAVTLFLKFVALFVTVWGARVWLIQFYSSALPFADQWDELGRFIKPWLEGTLSWKYWIEAFNEHRILATRVLDVCLLMVNGQWDAQVQMVANAAIAAAIACAFVGFGIHFCGKRFANLFFALIGLLFALPFGAENTLAGFQSQVYLLLLFSSLTIFALGFHEPGSKWWIAGIALSLVSLFTMGSGLLAPAVVALLMVARIFRSQDHRIASLTTLGVALAVTMIGVSLNVTVEDRLHQHAASLTAFLLAFAKNLSWPFVDFPWAMALLWLPLLIAGILYCRGSVTSVRAAEFALAVGVWVAIQAAAIAHGRGVSGRPPSSRHMDVLCIGAIANWMAIVVMLGLPKWRTNRARFPGLLLGVIWITAVILGSLHLSRESFGFVRDKKVDNLIEEQNVKSFLATGDEHYIVGKPDLEIPFPSNRANDLVDLLKDQTIRSLLPTGFIQASRPMGPLSEFNSKLLQHGWLILFTGLIAFVTAGVFELRHVRGRLGPTLIADLPAATALVGSLLFVWNLRNADERMFTAAYEKWIAARDYSMRDFPGSIAHGFEALARNPDDPETLNQLALALIAPGDISQRKPQQAVELAEHACALSRNVGNLETLGMAYAEASRFADAVRVTQESLDEASRAGQLDVVQKLRDRINVYMSGRPYRPSY